MPDASRAVLVCLVATALASGGCAGYAESVREVRSSLLAGDKARALDKVNDALDVDGDDELPEDIAGDTALLVLERGSIKQGLERWKSSSGDFHAADKHLELLDLKNDTAGNIGKYIFSDDSTVYKAPAYEKLLLNTLNMLNYLAGGDLEGARVEARRLTVMRDYLADEGSEQAALLGLGSYLAGFAFEMSGRPEEALRHYDEALADGARPSLDEPIRRLSGCTEFRSQRLTQMLGESESPGGCIARPEGTGTILVVPMTGLAPYKEPMRIPIGAALVIAASAVHGPGLGVGQRSSANRLAAKGLLTWINFPVMKRSPERFSTVRVRVDGTSGSPELGVDVTGRVLKAWDSIKGTLMVAAITRMITRAVAGEVSERAAKGGGAAGGLALLAGLAVQGAMVAADTPDTRSWVTLPSKVMLAREEVRPGRHEVTVVFEGRGGRYVVTKEVEVPDGGFVVVPVASMR